MGNCTSAKKGEVDDDDEDSAMHFIGGNVHLITKKECWNEMLSKAKEDGSTVVANFSATWCGPCREIAPFYSELSLKFTSLLFLIIDVDELTEFSSSWDIRATPTFIFLRNGQQIGKFVGANKLELEKKIQSYAESTLQPSVLPQSSLNE